jgi:hypothetical protein
MAAQGPATGCVFGVVSMLGHLIPYHFASNRRWIVPAHRTHLLEIVLRWLHERQAQTSKSGQHGRYRLRRLALILSGFR